MHVRFGHGVTTRFTWAFLALVVGCSNASDPDTTTTSKNEPACGIGANVDVCNADGTLAPPDAGASSAAIAAMMAYAGETTEILAGFDTECSAILAALGAPSTAAASDVASHARAQCAAALSAIETSGYTFTSPVPTCAPTAPIAPCTDLSLLGSCDVTVTVSPSGTGAADALAKAATTLLRADYALKSVLAQIADATNDFAMHAGNVPDACQGPTTNLVIVLTDNIDLVVTMNAQLTATFAAGD